VHGERTQLHGVDGGQRRKINIAVRVEIDVRSSLDERRVRQMIEEELARLAAALKQIKR
jgi:hypothetical protein